MAYIFTIILGLIIGSFLNVCIARIPKGESVVKPSSYCDKCNQRLRLRDLIPVFSWLLLRGKCRYCNAKISVQYPLVEMLTAALFSLIYYLLGPVTYVFPSMLLTSILIVISFTDYNNFLIPNKVIIAGFVLGLFTHLISPTITWKNVIFGFWVGGGILFLLTILSKGGIGGGDIKLASLIGFYLGWQKVLLAIFLGSLAGLMYGLVLILNKKITSKDPIPFGPFLSFGAFLNIILINTSHPLNNIF